MTTKELRAEHERELLSLLADGAEWTRNDLLYARNHTLSEWLVHSIMTELEKQGRVVISKRSIKGRHSKFMFTYRLSAAA